MAGENNPRVFADTISLDAWRTPFDGERGEADLHINVSFDAGRVGGDGSSIRFRLSLKRAEVRVVRDNEKIIQIKPASMMRAELPKPGRTALVVEKSGLAGAGADLGISEHGLAANAKVSAAAKVKYTEKTEVVTPVLSMKVADWNFGDGHGFKVSATGRSLAGQPWDARKPVMKLQDTNGRRKRGEPPEVRVEIHCLREDLLIENIQFTDTSFPDWLVLPRTKQIAVEAYIKDELARAGLACGDLSDPYTRIVLADAMPSEA